MDDALRAELAQLRQRLGELEDREAIRELTARYMQAMHDARWEDAVACFADQACYDHGVLGELRSKQEIRSFYTEFMPRFEAAGGWAFDLLADPVIEVDGDRAQGRWFLLTLLIDPDTQEAAWSMATLEYEYTRERGQWRFARNRCIHEHLLVDHRTGWGRSGRSKVPDLTAQEDPGRFAAIRALGGRQRPGRLCRSIRGWTVPTREPEPGSA
jgi:hypothetical protein